jgi:hypothetical protein
VANLCDDADTTCAIYGQLAGAWYGEEGIPKEWRERVSFRHFISAMADELWNLSEKTVFVASSSISSKCTTSTSPPSISTSSVFSVHYEFSHSCILLWEELFTSQDVKRKLQPGLHQYKSLEQLKSDIESLQYVYSARLEQLIEKLLVHYSPLSSSSPQEEVTETVQQLRECWTLRGREVWKEFQERVVGVRKTQLIQRLQRPSFLPFGKK